MGRRFILLLLVLAAVLIVTAINYYFLVHGLGVDDGPVSNEEALAEAAVLSDTDARVREMLRIRASVAQELRSFEANRQSLVSEVSELRLKRESLKSDLIRLQKEVDRTRSLLQQLELDRRDAAIRKSPLILRPLKLQPAPESLSSAIRRSESTLSPAKCDMSECFDFSLCPLTSGCPVYLYTKSDPKLQSNLKSRNDIILVNDPADACLFVAIASALFPVSAIREQSHWNGGMNHMIFNIVPHLVLNETQVEKSILIQSTFSRSNFRDGFDLISLPVRSGGAHVRRLLSPARRKYMASCAVSNVTSDAVVAINLLRRLQANAADSFLFVDAFDAKILTESTFYLIFADHAEQDLISSENITEQVIDCMKHGSIPVIIARKQVRLPLHQIIDWNRVTLFVPGQRVTELFLILKSFHDKDLLEMRRSAGVIIDKYFRDMSTFIVSAIANVRQKRLQIPAPAVPSIPVSLYYNADRPMKQFDVAPADPEAESSELDENLGPVESPFPSESFERNLSLVMSSGYSLWNSDSLNPFFTYPSTPFDPLLPSESKFRGSEFGFRPIGGGSGGSGKEFSLALGGNEPKEQFTIVMLTYEREAVLLDSLQRLKGLPFLNKVIVVWNNPVKKPDPALVWPNIQVPVSVIIADKNSLNNRFLPFDIIETDAILSLDDDAHLRHDEIVFGFRVWREAKDRIVGFPGRFHAWDLDHNSWLYNSNYSCELSMVLTGAAFFHKYYAYMYTYAMPQVIRDLVDEFTNCEDIAMNFLVSDLTRKPPIKVTSRWTFSCPGCPVALSENAEHFEERHKCINIFEQALGYNPLLNTQFRADSVLFKTRIPRDKQKCFRHV